MNIVKNWSGLNDQDDKRFEELCDRYIPARGKSSTVGGEILRAISRLVYRFFNDGDTVDRYYGGYYNYLITANKYLMEMVPKYSDLSVIYSDYHYQRMLWENVNIIFHYVLDNPQLFEIPNDRDFVEEGHCEKYIVRDEEDDEDY